MSSPAAAAHPGRAHSAPIVRAHCALHKRTRSSSGCARAARAASRHGHGTGASAAGSAPPLAATPQPFPSGTGPATVAPSAPVPAESGPQPDPTASELLGPSTGRGSLGEDGAPAPSGPEAAAEASTASAPEASPIEAAAALAGNSGLLTASLASYGENQLGELCVGWHSSPQGPQVTLAPFGALSQFAASEGDDYFDIAGRLWACGTNEYGTEGTGAVSHATETPVPVDIPAQVEQISAHGWQAIARTADGRVWTWGSDAFGQVGNGISTHGREEPGLIWPKPAPVAGVEHAVSVQSGGPDDVVVLANGDVWGWGGNFGGELGVAGAEQTRPVQIRSLSGKGVVSVTTGGFLMSGGDIYALTAHGTVLAQGRNELGELGGPGATVPLPPVKEVVASVQSAYAVTDEGSLYAWGSDSIGQLGIGSAPEWCEYHSVPCSRKPVKVALTGVTQVCAGQAYAAAISNGRVYTFGSNIYGSLGGAAEHTATPLPVPGLRNVAASAISCGRFHVVVKYDSVPLLPLLTRAVGSGDVALTWRSGPMTDPWHVLYRVAKPGSTYQPEIKLPASSEGYVLAGLTPGVTYEVQVKNPDWGTRLMWVTPAQ
jgi:hypothetical protein